MKNLVKICVFLLCMNARAMETETKPRSSSNMQLNNIVHHAPGGPVVFQRLNVQAPPPAENMEAEGQQARKKTCCTKKNAKTATVVALAMGAAVGGFYACITYCNDKQHPYSP